MSIGPRLPVSWLSWTTPYPLHAAGQSMRSPARYRPFRSAAAAVTGLNEEPVGYCPFVARARSGFFGSAFSAAIAALSPLTNRLRSYDRRLARDRKSVV